MLASGRTEDVRLRDMSSQSPQADTNNHAYSMTRVVPQRWPMRFAGKSADTPETYDYPKKLLWKREECG